MNTNAIDKRTAAAKVLDTAKSTLDEVNAMFRGKGDRPRQRTALNDTADAICRDLIEQAELREYVTKKQAEQLRDRVHAYAGKLHER